MCGEHTPLPAFGSNGAGTDNQSICYDELNRLTSAATSGTPPCGGTIGTGTLSGGSYSSTYTYDALNRLTSVGGSGAQALGYGPGMQQSSPAPLHGVVSASSTTYGYDAAGDRTNAGYASNLISDAERRLVGWANGATTGSAAYDGEGHRVAMQTVTTSAPPPTPGRVVPKGPVGYTSTTTTTYYVLGLEDVTSGVLTKYLGAGGTLPSAVRVGSTLSYLAGDGLGSITEALDTSGNVTAQQLYAPYGSVRYSVGTLPTTKGYAGQRLDASSGLGYDAARYYDSGTEQFASADTASDPGNGLNRLAYVGGNPETRTDPSGHCIADDSGHCIHHQSGGPSGGNPNGNGGDGGPTCNQAGCSPGNDPGDSFCLPYQPFCSGYCLPGEFDCGAKSDGNQTGTPTPTQDQIDAAKGVAKDTAGAIYQEESDLLKLLAGLAVGSSLSDDPRIRAATAAVGLVILEIDGLAALFSAEANYGDDFWSDPHNLIHFRTLIDAAIVGINAAVATASGLLAVATFGAGVIPGAGAIAGALFATGGLISVTNQAIGSEMDDLGYQQFEGNVW